jgi:3-deoxy-D-manno-octulosonic-acid transferase
MLAPAIIELFSDSALREKMGEAGKTLVVENRGALQRSYDLITKMLALN